MAMDEASSGLGALSPELIQKIASLMDLSDVALNLRPVNTYFAGALSAYRAARLRAQPQPRHCSMGRRGVFPPRILLPVVACQPWPGAAFMAHWRRAEPWRALNRRQRLHVLSLAASSLHAPSLDAALAHAGVAIGVETLASAAAVGDLAACRKLFRSVWYRRDLRNDAGLASAAAARNGHLRVCRWLLAAAGRRGDARLLCDLVLLACHGGHEGFAQALLTRAVQREDAKWDDLAVAAAEGGRPRLLERLAGPVGGVWSAALALGGVAYGCPLEVLQAYYPRWGGEGAALAWQRQHLLLRAAASPTSDWAAKCGWLLGQWEAGAGAGAGWPGAAERGLQPAELLDVRGIPEVVPAHRVKLIRHLMTAPDCVSRLRYLHTAAGFALPPEVAEEAAAAGDVAAVAFCLDQIESAQAQAQQRQQQQQLQLQRRGDEDEQVEGPERQGGTAGLAQVAERVAVAAAYAGQVPVLRLLAARGFLRLPHWHLMEVLGVRSSGRYHRDEHDWRRRLPVVQHMLLEQGGRALSDVVGRSGWGWRSLFMTAATYGVDDTAVLRLIYQQNKTSIRLEALARGGSEAQLDWAAAELAAAGQPLQPLAAHELVTVLRDGNLLAADWLLRRDLGPPRSELWRLVWRLLVAGEHGGLPLASIAWLAARAGSAAVSGVRCVAVVCWALAAWQAWSGLHDKAMRRLTRAVTYAVLGVAAALTLWRLGLATWPAAECAFGGRVLRESLQIAEQPWPGSDFVAHWGRPEPWRALNRRDRHRLLCLAASSLHAPSLDAALAHCGTAVAAGPLASAAAVGDLAALQRLVEQEGCEWLSGRQVWPAAACFNQLHVCRWLTTIGSCEDAMALHLMGAAAAASYKGHEELARWAAREEPAARGIKLNPTKLAVAAATGGQVALLEQVAPKVDESPVFSRALGAVAYGCPLEVLQAYYPRWGPERWGGPGPFAAMLGHLGHAQGSASDCLKKKEVLLRALLSPTPDWAAKAEWLLAQWRPLAGWASGNGTPALWEGVSMRPEWRLAISYPDTVQRLQWLGAQGLGPLPCEAAEAAAAAGELCALRFCLELELELTQPAVAAQQQQQEQEQGQEQQQQQQQEQGQGQEQGQEAPQGQVAPQGQDPRPRQDDDWETPASTPLGRVADAAAAAQQVAVLRMLREERGLVLSMRHALRSLGHGDTSTLWGGWGAGVKRCGAGPVVRYLVTEDGVLEQPDWDVLFKMVAKECAELPLLRFLHEQRGAAVDLAAVAQGGGAEACEWAAAELAATGRLQPLSVPELFGVVLGCNLSTLDWLLGHGLIPVPNNRLNLSHLFVALVGPVGAGYTALHALPALRWLVERGGLVWTPACIVALSECGENFEGALSWGVLPCHRRWLQEMRAAADAALGAGPGAGAGAEAGALAPV
ncbi:hypothetical protein HYH02_008137 [Chlamydomonas schloesseri]|uniref:Uncharacterized protein n=1 Tax=Chlamydomonas schloesseri TaxID=2026947 RepID=A0A835WGB9_9CHLO|nr:hypothetical protein HYH02_008137 [Chlamydomonas schloesseri]|eukprot:KAG2446983.1 hypothetical protein HYH02_008137 [Chlamydomonas schloesseri]